MKNLFPLKLVLAADIDKTVFIDPKYFSILYVITFVSTSVPKQIEST